MKLTAGRIYDAFGALENIIQKPRMIPQLAKYKIARMHDALEKVAAEIDTQHNQLVLKYGENDYAPEDVEKKTPIGFRVDTDGPNGVAYIHEWTEARAVECEVEVTPLTLVMLGNDPRGVEAIEYKMLGELVVDNTAV